MNKPESLSGRSRRVQWLLPVLLVAVTSFLDAGGAIVRAQGTPPGYKGKPLPVYPGNEGDCYVLLKNQFPYVQGGDYPVCRAVLRNLNRFCDEPPQYDRRRIHPAAKDLNEPAWKEIPSQENLDLIRETCSASSLPQYRQEQWDGVATRITVLAEAGKLTLDAATIDLKLGSGEHDVYRLQNYNAAAVPAGYDQPHLMITEAVGERVPSPRTELGGDLLGDLWGHADAWYLVGFEPSEPRLFVKQLTRPRSGISAPFSAITRCTLMYAIDNK